MCREAIVEQVDGLDFGHIVDCGVVEQWHKRIFDHRIATTRTSIELLGDAVGGGVVGVVRIGEIGVWHYQVLRIGVGPEVVLKLVGVSRRSLIVLSATQHILCRKASSEHLIDLSELRACRLEAIYGDVFEIIDIVDIAHKVGAAGDGLRYAQFCAWIVIVHAGVEEEGRKTKRRNEG